MGETQNLVLKSEPLTLTLTFSKGDDFAPLLRAEKTTEFNVTGISVDENSAYDCDTSVEIKSGDATVTFNNFKWEAFAKSKKFTTHPPRPDRGLAPVNPATAAARTAPLSSLVVPSPLLPLSESSSLHTQSSSLQRRE